MKINIKEAQAIFCRRLFLGYKVTCSSGEKSVTKIITHYTLYGDEAFNASIFGEDTSNHDWTETAGIDPMSHEYNLDYDSFWDQGFSCEALKDFVFDCWEEMDGVE